MDTLRDFRMEFRRDGPRPSDCYVYLRARPPAEHPLASRDGELELFFSRSEFERFCARSTTHDVFRESYRVNIEVRYGEKILIVDMGDVYDPPREARMAGRATVAFLCITMPAFVRRYMGKVARRVWDSPMWLAAIADHERERSYDHDPTRVRPVVPLGDPARWLRLYGQGKGHVFVDGDERAHKRLALAERTPGFVARLEQCAGIARASTRGHHQTARLRVSCDCGANGIGTGFSWAAYTPRGQFIMNGGLLYHGPQDGNGSGSGPTFAVVLGGRPEDTAEGQCFWSIHT